jgi:sialate O-acetylesterase
MFPASLAPARWLASGLLTLTTLSAVQAAVRFHPLFTDHAVLQQGKPVPVWGWADPGEAVRVEFGSLQAATVADDLGRWQVQLRPLKATAAPRTLRAIASNTAEVHDVVVGEVWICSGQSNMEWPLSRSHQPEADIQASANPLLRVFTVVKARSRVALPNFKEPEKHLWKNAAPEAVRDFSAVGYYFGRDLQASLGIPVGIIHTSWGGSPAEVWMSDDVLRDNHVYDRDILRPWVSQRRGNLPNFAKWDAEREAALAANQPFTKSPPWPGWTPSELYNAMIAPLLPYGLRGAIWYQGESNAGRAYEYRSLYADMIRNWRRDFAQPDFPFYAVQLAPWDKNRKRDFTEIAKTPGESDWAELREAQTVASQAVGHAGVAVITDVGDKDDIHPTQKGPVGTRLSLLARRDVYAQRILAEGPVLASRNFEGDHVTLSFSQRGDGLKSADGGPLTGFAVAGSDRKWHWAQAEIVKGAVRVSCPEVPQPVAVRYGWSDYPIVNLVNSAGLPASPFRTDDWPLTTKR